MVSVSKVSDFMNKKRILQALGFSVLLWVILILFLLGVTKYPNILVGFLFVFLFVGTFVMFYQEF